MKNPDAKGGFGGERIRDYMEWQYVLIHDSRDPNHPDALREDRAEALEMISNLFDSCYKIGLNPLQRIRKVFDKFDWVYQDFDAWYEKRCADGCEHEVAWTEKEDRRRKTILESDFFWIPLCDDIIVTARLKDKSAAPLAIWGDVPQYKWWKAKTIPSGAKIWEKKPEADDDEDLPNASKKAEKDPRGEIKLKLALM